MLKIGIAGARGLSVVKAIKATEEATVVAICDMNEDLLKTESVKHDIPKTYRVYEDMLQSDLDAVIVATPMQLHVQQTLQALNAGKHVLSEVTAGVSFDELFWLVEEVEKSGKVYMMAENYLYSQEVQQVLAMSKAGLFGEPYFGEGEYLHNIINYTTYKDGTPSWRKWWQYGTRGLFYPTHSLGPVMKWFGEEDQIDFVVALGTGAHTRPEHRLDDTSVALLQMKSGKLIKLRLDCISRRPHLTKYYSLQGTKGVYEAPRMHGEHMVSFSESDNPDNPKWLPLSQFSEYIPQRYKDFAKKAKEVGHGGIDFYMIQDFIDAIKGIKAPAVDVYDACEWTAVGLLSSLSVTNKGRAMDMPNFRSKSLKDHIVRI